MIKVQCYKVGNEVYESFEDAVEAGAKAQIADAIRLAVRQTPTLTAERITNILFQNPQVFDIARDARAKIKAHQARTKKATPAE